MKPTLRKGYTFEAKIEAKVVEVWNVYVPGKAVGSRHGRGKRGVGMVAKLVDGSWMAIPLRGETVAAARRSDAVALLTEEV